MLSECGQYHKKTFLKGFAKFRVSDPTSFDERDTYSSEMSTHDKDW